MPCHGRKFSKTIIAPEERPIGPYRFGIFLVLSSPNYGQNINAKSFDHLGYFPRNHKSEICIVRLGWFVNISLFFSKFCFI